VLTSAAEPLLNVCGLKTGYGKIAVLHGVDLRVARSEVVTLLGPNGAGKTTLLRAVSGLLPCNGGGVQFDGRDIVGRGSHERVWSMWSRGIECSHSNL
jgi:branched-chain amino acid transport system ATP-binding protein